MIFTGADASVSIWDMNNFTHVETIDEPGNQIGAMDFANDGITFATAGKVNHFKLMLQLLFIPLLFC